MNEKLIDEAREAVGVAKDSIWRTSPDADGDARHEAVLDQMLAAFEKAHTPTDGEREADEKAVLNALYNSREAFTGVGAEVGTDETAILVDHVPDIVLALGFRRSVVPEPSVEEFRARIADERARQVDLGYDILHDRHHGVDHLLGWAIDYVRRGRTVQAAALIEAARELRAKSAEPSPDAIRRLESEVAQSDLSAEGKAWVTVDAKDIRAALDAATPEPSAPGESSACRGCDYATSRRCVKRAGHDGKHLLPVPSEPQGKPSDAPSIITRVEWLRESIERERLDVLFDPEVARAARLAVLDDAIAALRAAEAKHGVADGFAIL